MKENHSNKGKSEKKRKRELQFPKFPAGKGFHVIRPPMGPERNFDHEYFL